MKNILEYLEISAACHADKVVFSDVNKSVTYAEFILACKKVATVLSQRNIRNCPVAVFDNRNVDTLIAMFGVLYSGNFYVVIDPHSPTERIGKIFDILKPQCSVIQSDNLSLAQSLNVSDYVDLNSCMTVGVDEDKLQAIRSRAISTDPAYVLFTSGSTGAPKGAVLSHSNVISYVEWFIEAFNINSDTVFANQAPFYFSVSVSDIYGTVFAGATLNITPKSYFAFPIQLVNFLNERQVNTIYWVPSALCIVANIKLFDYAKPQYLRTVLFAGEIMPNRQLNYWRKSLPFVTFANLFGPTETTDICTYYVVDREFADEQSLPIGKHCSNCDTFIVDENGREITQPDKVGELYARGAFVAYGYYDNKDKTDVAFVQNPLHNHYRDIVYRTGDLVKLNTYGEYEYVGRRDFQIKHKGYRIELGEIETGAGAIPNVNACVCVYDKDKDIIVLVYQGKIKKEDLLEQIKLKVPQYMTPELIIKVSQMPYNANGKIDRNYLSKNYELLNK